CKISMNYAKKCQFRSTYTLQLQNRWVTKQYILPYTFQGLLMKNLMIQRTVQDI
ncbi:hypothetical protein L9F63_010831, partial [Diploptera punctata]